MRYTLSWVALLAVSVNAAQVSFRVFAPGATDVQVSIGGQNTPLTAADPTIPYFTGTAEAADGATYKYVIGGTAEAFERTLVKGSTSTYNDFANRSRTYGDIPELPWPIADRPQWTRGGKPHSIWDSNYIPTIWVQGEAGPLNALVTAPHKNKVPVTLTVVLANEIKTFKNVQFGIHGAGKKKNNAKQSWNWRLDGTDKLANRNFFKMRHMEEDPTQIREKLYADILQAMGTYVNEANMVRMYINGEGFGTFNLLDDITEYSFPSAMWYEGNPPVPMGALFDGGSGASFAYDPTGNSYYNWVANPASPELPPAVNDVCLKFNQTVKTDDAQIAEVDKMIDLDYFMRFMVMEYLTGHWDGYWEQQTNIGLYRDPTDNNRWYFIGQDFDGTFGINVQTNDTTYPEWSFTTFPTHFPNGVLINGLLENANQKAKFQKYLTETVRVLFNNVTLTNRILKYHDFILEDLKWDRSITQRSPGINFGWTFEHVTQNLWHGVAGTNAANPGGAAYGLIEWIIKKSNAVAKEFNVQIVTEPAGPPADGLPKPQQPGVTPPAGGNADGDKNKGGDKPDSGVADLSPKALVTVALVGAASFIALF
ncbi:hypothetical protein BGW42_006802 [Actinomortierella wolfii]|nr:hypothetical protein BGW42_006802 [Actinomortierella wolfii]